MSIEIRLPSIDKLRRNLNVDVILQPEIDDARDTIVTRINRQGKGLGAQRNTLMSQTRPLGATVTSTLKFPRTTGRSWGDKNVQIVTAMGPNVVRKMVSRIKARWAGAF